VAKVAPSLSVGFARALRERRTQIGISQEELAFQAHLHRTYVSQLERGLKTPSLQSIAGLASALGMPAWQLVRAAEEGEGGS
jgi:transcriptional regulator with XRE-family HTH domain